MKRVLCIMLAIAMTVCAFSACSKTEEPTTTKQSTEPVSNGKIDVDGLMTPDEVMQDASVVDLEHYMETEGLSKQEVKDDESATSKLIYTDSNDNLVYIKYIGYGEDCFDYYTKSNDGRELVVKYIMENGKTSSVDASTKDYTISYNELSSLEKYGAKMINITVSSTEQNDLPKVACYELNGKEFRLISNKFYTDDAYNLYTCYYDEDKPEEQNSKLFQRVDTPSTNDDLKDMVNDHRVKSAEFIAGKHKLEYTEDSNGKKWYIVADIYLVTNSKLGAEQLASKYGLSVNQEFSESDYSCVVTAAVPIAENTDWFLDFAQQEFDDYTFARINLSSDGEVTDITTADTSLVYY